MVQTVAMGYIARHPEVYGVEAAGVLCHVLSPVWCVRVCVVCEGDQI